MAEPEYTRPRTRLYLITPPQIADVDEFAAVLETALDAGDVACLQLRLKTPDGMIDEAATRAVAAAVTELAQARGVAVIINDSPDLAVELGTDGVHVGWDDVPVKQARAIVGKDMIIGATAKNSRHVAMQAGEAGADYVAFGAFFATGTKQAKTFADPEILRWWSELMTVPCVAIGGITVANCAVLVEAGADFLAVVSGVWDYPEGPAAAVAAFNEEFARILR